MTPQEEAELASLRSDATPSAAPKALPPAQAKLREMVLRGKNITPRDISRLIGEMKSFGSEPSGSPAIEQPPSFEPPQLSSGQTKGGGFNSKDAQELERMRNEADVATPFADLADRAKEFFIDKPAQAAHEIRQAAITKMGAPSEEELVKRATESGHADIPGIIGRISAQTLTEAVPLTPTEIAATAIGGKALEVGAPFAARAAGNLGKRVLASGLEAALPAAEQAIALQGLRAEGRSAATGVAKGLARQLPKVESEIANLAKGVRASEEPIRDLLAPTAKVGAVTPKTVSEVQDQAQVVAPKPGPKNPKGIPSAATPASGDIRASIKQARQVAREAVAVPKESRPAKTNIVELRVLQDKANAEAALAKERGENSFFGRFKAFDQIIGTSGWKNLERLGPVGQKLKTLADSSLAAGEIRAGGAKVLMRDAISKLTDVEKQNLITVLDEGAQPVTNSVRIAAEALRAIDKQIANEATGLLKLKSTDSVIPWVGRKFHFPHIMDIEATERLLAEKGTSRYNEIVHAVASKQKNKTSFVEAERILRDMLNRHKASNFGPLERSRQFDSPFWIKDVDKALSTYYDGAFKRLEIAKAFGPQNEKGSALLSMVKDDNLRKMGTSIIDTVVGKETESTTEAVVKQALSAPIRIASESMMGLSQISNSLQGVYGSAIRGGLRNALKGMAETWNPTNFATRKEARDFAIKSGSLIEDIALESSARTTSKDFLKKSGFTFFEEMNRIVSANTAKHYANDLMMMMREGKNVDLVERELVKFGLNRSDIIKRGAFSDYEVKKIANAFTNIGQGRSRPIDLPLFANTAAGKVFFHLKNFGFNWSRMVKDEVINEAAHGNTAPLANLLLTGAVLGEPIAITRELITGAKRPDSFLARRAEAIAWIGGVGIMGEVVKTALTGRGNLASAASASAGVEATKAAFDTLQGARQQPGKAAPLITATKFAGRRLAPLAASAIPTPLVLPYLIGTRAIGERADKIVPALGEAINKRLGKK